MDYTPDYTLIHQVAVLAVQEMNRLKEGFDPFCQYELSITENGGIALKPIYHKRKKS